MLPHPNIRSLLSLHGKVSPEKAFLIHHTSDGRREELPFAEVSARVHQTANLLQEDLNAQPGDRIAILVNNPADAAVFCLAGWIVGAVVVPLNPADDDAALAARMRDSGASICIASHEHIARIQNQLPPGCHLMQVGGLPQSDILYFNELVKNLPNTFFNDHAAPTLDSPALWISAAEIYSQGDLLSAAQNIALAQSFTGNQRIMSLLPFHTRADITLALLMPLLVGGSVVLNPRFALDTFWRHITAEHAQIAIVAPHHLQAFLDFADSQRNRGEPIWGSGVHQQDLTRFRHLICADSTLDPALVQAVRDRLGLMVSIVDLEL